ncbi:MAG: CBS domain-containing protein, partial [Campylobacterota bacterium]|nr:CBS domain-containing protein [Campylobacterota bacterium]
FPVRSLVLKNSAIMTNKGVVLDTLIKNLDSMPTDCIVVHENNIPKGIITKKDITYRIAKKEPLDCLVEECMSYPILSINGDITIRKALDIMNEHRYKRIFVTDNDGELLGIITQKELVSVIYHKFSHKTVKSIDKLNHILEKKVNSKSEEIIEIKERYEHALSASTHGLWDWNLITDEIVISQQLENMLGIEKKSVKSMSLNFYNLIDENDRVKVISAREKAMDNDKEMFEVEYRIIDKNNNYIWVKDRARIIYNNGCPIRIVATVSNITEHKNMQDEIKKTKRYFIPSGTS